MVDNEKRVAAGLFDRAGAAHDEGLRSHNPTWAESYFRSAADYKKCAMEHLLEAEYWKTYLKEPVDAESST